MTFTKRLLAIAVSASALTSVSITTFATAQAAGAPVTGSTFRDYDNDGERDPLEPGQSGVEVRAVDAAGESVSTRSAADGSYSLDVSGLAGTRFRVEFRGLPDHLKPARSGPGNGTDVQFVDAGGTADFAAVNPAEYCSASAELITTCFQGGAAAANGPAVVAFPQDAGTTSTSSNDGAASSSQGEGMASHADLAFDDVVGPVRGLAWKRSTRTIFAGSYAKRHTAYPAGPDAAGPDRIWAIPRDGGSPSVFFTADAGPDNHDYSDLIADAAFWDEVGRTGWGDVDLSVDEETLYAANMFDRRVYAVPVSGNPPVAGAATTIDLGPSASADCGSDDWAPGGIKAKDDAVYLSVTCTAATSQARGDLQGLVYRLGPGGALTRVAQFGLGYARGQVSGQAGVPAPSEWLPWSDTEKFRPSPTDPNPFGQVYYPQPWLTDLEFDEAGNLLVGVTDRAGDQFGNDNGAAPAGNNEGVTAGDTVRLVPAPGGTWVSNATSGDFLGSEQYPLAGPTHTEITLGHLALRLGSGQVVANAFDPAPVGGPVRTTDGGTVLATQSFRSGGIVTMDTASGARARSYQLFGVDTPGTFGKAAGIGDVEFLCDNAPLEIGDYVWEDTDGDGLQDPDEAPIPGVTVNLYDAQGNVVATTTTGSDGRYYFPADPDTDYTIRFDNPADYAAGGPLADLVPTGADTGSNDLADSDATVTDGFGSIPVRTGPPGSTDHDFDAGFSPTYSLGNQVWIDADRDGTKDADESLVPGVEVVLLDGDGNPVLGPDGQPLTDTTDADGRYLFTDLPPGDYVVSVIAENFATGGPLQGLASTPPTSGNADDDVDNDDNGSPVTGGSVRSTPITLGPGEPVGEDPDNDPGTPDTRSNLTVDFGFVPTYSLGNQVWIDTDRDGTKDAGESLVPGVKVVLLDADGNPVLGPDGRPSTATTDADGRYLFADLPPGDYVVCVPAENFLDGGPLDGLLSTPPTSADANDDVDNDDNGSPGPAGSVCSTPITLGPGEPTGETPDNDPDTPDANSNLTVDFGFVLRTSDLAVDKRLVGALVAGRAAAYALEVANTGPDSTGSSVVVTDRLPSGLRPTSARGGGFVCTIAGPRVTCTRARALDPDESVTIRLEVQVTATSGTSITNRARVALVDGPPVSAPDPGPDVPDTVDPRSPNNTDEITATTQPPAAQPDTDGPDLPDTGAPSVLLWLLLAGGLIIIGTGFVVSTYRSSRRSGQ
jgi:uncharacterized repeat protein (TIGR01451 family)